MAAGAAIGSAGELLVEFVCTEKDGRNLRPSSYLGPFPSGAPGIFIDQAAKIGARTIFAGAVGDDAFGTVLLRRLQADGVDLGLISRVPAMPTGSAFVSYNGDGSRDFVFNIAHSAAARLDLGPATATAMQAFGIGVFHVSGSSLGDPAMRSGILDLCRQLRAAGVKISFDPNIRKELLSDGGYLAEVTKLMAMSQYFLPSDADAEVLFRGATLADFGGRLIAAGAEAVVLKRGAQGCEGLAGDGSSITLPAHRVEVNDPTGAGDCFCATFIALLATGSFGFEAALTRANAAGALAVTKIGPMEGNATLAEIETFLAAQS